MQLTFSSPCKGQETSPLQKWFRDGELCSCSCASAILAWLKLKSWSRYVGLHETVTETARLEDQPVTREVKVYSQLR